MDATPPNQRPTPDEVKKVKRRIAGKYTRARQRRAESSQADKDARFAALRLKDLDALFRHRWGITLPDDDAGLDDLSIRIHYTVMARRPPEKAAATWAPWCPQSELDRMIQEAHMRPVKHGADELAELLGLDYATRQRLAITTIGSIDCDKAERDRLRRQRDNESAQRKRQQARQHGPTLTAKQRKVLNLFGGSDTAVPDLVKRLKRAKEFRDLASPRQEVHRILDHLVRTGWAVDCFRPGPKGTPIRYVRRIARGPVSS